MRLGSLIISGAYGRDYKVGYKALEDLFANKDFVIRNFGPHDGRYINWEQLKPLLLDGSCDSVEFRFNRDAGCMAYSAEEIVKRFGERGAA